MRHTHRSARAEKSIPICIKTESQNPFFPPIAPLSFFLARPPPPPHHHHHHITLPHTVPSSAPSLACAAPGRTPLPLPSLSLLFRFDRYKLRTAFPIAAAGTLSCVQAAQRAYARTAGQPIPAATQNMVMRAESKRPKPTGASGPKKVVPRIASATVDGIDWSQIMLQLHGTDEGARQCDVPRIASARSVSTGK